MLLNPGWLRLALSTNKMIWYNGLDYCDPENHNGYSITQSLILFELRDHYNFEVDLLCGATLVSSLSLLTAAHCVNNKKQASHFHLRT